MSPIPSLKRINTWQKRPLKKTKKKIFGRFISLLFFLFIIGGLFVVISFIYLGYNLPDPNKLLERAVAQSTKILDRTGKTLLYEIFTAQRRTMIPLSDVPRDLIFATIVIEDKDFYTHPGFDLRGIARAIIVDVLSLGKKVQGGSTITQQFIKNSLLTPKKNLCPQSPRINYGLSNRKEFFQRTNFANVF